jgi:phosphoglycerate kinase
MIHPTFFQWKIKNNRVFVRADLNIPLAHGKIINDFRLTSILPTINFILDHHGSIVLATHIGEPKNNNPILSTKILVPWFEQHGYSIEFIEDIATISPLKIMPKHILLLENLRFFPGEKNGDPFFAKQLANTAYYYINDAFGVSHRNDCSVTLLPYEFPENRRSIGLLIEKELQALNMLKNNPPRPFIAILGGKKIKDKIPLIHNLLNKVDTLLLCPALCFSFLKSLGKPVGQSLIDDSMLAMCKTIILKAESSNTPCLFPVDYQVAYDNQRKEQVDGPFSIVPANKFPHNAIGISIGPKTVELFAAEINQAKTIFLNCAMGFANKPETQESTKDIINAMATSSAKTVIAGGDSVDIALNTKNYQLINHLSTGGGAALAYLSDTLLPGLAAFEEE